MNRFFSGVFFYRVEIQKLSRLHVPPIFFFGGMDKPGLYNLFFVCFFEYIVHAMNLIQVGLTFFTNPKQDITISRLEDKDNCMWTR